MANFSTQKANPEEFWAIRRLEITVPSSGRSIDRFAALKISIRQRCERLRRCPANDEAVSLIVDSTGACFGYFESEYALLSLGKTEKS